MAHPRWRGSVSVALASLLAIGLVVALGQRPALAAAPIARNDAYTTPAGTTLTVAAPGVLANDSDPDGDPLTAGMPTNPKHGAMTIEGDGSFTYAPAPGFTGNDTFTYMAHDTMGGMTTATVTVTVGSGGGQSPTLSVSDVSVTEGSAGTTRNAVFTITRSGNTASSSKVSYATANGTAIAGSDYTAKPTTTLTFAAGVTSKTVTVKVTGDNVDEPDEAFSFDLTSPTGATIADGTGIGTIVDDDGAAPTSSFTVSDARVTEANSGTTADAVFTISRSDGTGAASVKYLTTGGTATPGSDYTAVPLSVVTFAAGQTSKTVTVKVLGDNVAEANETFFVKLSAPTGATIADAKGIATIVDND